MTVSTEISSNEYTGNGVTTDFDYKFRIFKANQLSVITSDADGDNVVTLRLGTDYTVTGANKSTGGKVILTRPLANGHKISIARDIPITQETSFRNQGKFLAETHEDAFDYLTMIIQRIWGSLGSLYLKRPNILANWFDAKGYRIANLGKPKRDTDAVDLGTLKDEVSGVNSTILKREKRVLRVDDMDISALPKASDRAGNVLTFDKDGKPIVVAPATGSAVDVLNKLAMDNGSKLIGHKKPYEGAVSRTAADYFNQEINIDDFGAKGDALLFNGEKNPNRTDDSNAIQNAIVQAWLHGGVKVTATPWKSYYVPKTIYTLATDSKASDAYKSKYVNRRIQIIDFQGARFIGRDDTSDTTNCFMESGYLKSDMTIGTVFDGSNERHLTYATSTINMELNSFYRGFNFRNHIYGCTIQNVITFDVQQVSNAERCFVSEWRSISAHGSYTDGLPRYRFYSNSNIIALESIAPSYCDIAYLFEGSTEAVKLTLCGIEGYKTAGIKFNGSAYNLEIDSCYLESDSGHAITAINMKHITVNNCWIYGNTTVFGELGQAVGVRWNPNNMYQDNVKMFDDNLVSQYNLSDFTLHNTIAIGNKKIDKFSGVTAMNVHQTLTAFNPAVGVSNSGVLGKIEQTNDLHSIRVNGRTSKGKSAAFVVGSEVEILTNSDSTTSVKYKTGITYSTTQLVYVNISIIINSSGGEWNWAGFIVGSVSTPLVNPNNSAITVLNEGGYLSVRTQGISSSEITPRGGEIRII
ncbi:hypothetical protein [Providencia sp. PROV069]|uniref:hypothetical protein n=1 Tax=Providencia sp. PROV069 TaxID=2949795 RepID=UPI002349AC30|nr:hypothetical protein [Providencia sp. PROV069]